VKVELDPKSRQGDLVAALEPVFDRAMRKYNAAREALTVARQRADERGAAAAQEELDALLLFRSDMGAYVRLYTFLSQIFDYGQTELEKRAIFYKRLIPLLDFDREQPGSDLSRSSSHHTLHQPRNAGARPRAGRRDKLDPITEAERRRVHERERASLRDLIERINELFSGDLTENDKLVYVNQVLRRKLLESKTLQQQAASNSKEQFASSPDLSTELESAIMDAYDAHTSMSQQALSSKSIQAGLLKLLLDYAGLYEELKARAAG
jgi:type I restriction enzyme R subunit